eukprot:Clim_evm30s108 gene=Clim_evmTU30s108
MGSATRPRGDLLPRFHPTNIVPLDTLSINIAQGNLNSLSCSFDGRHVALSGRETLEVISIFDSSGDRAEPAPTQVFRNEAAQNYVTLGPQQIMRENSLDNTGNWNMSGASVYGSMGADSDFAGSRTRQPNYNPRSGQWEGSRDGHAGPIQPGASSTTTSPPNTDSESTWGSTTDAALEFQSLGGRSSERMRDHEPGVPLHKDFIPLSLKSTEMVRMMRLRKVCNLRVGRSRKGLSFAYTDVAWNQNPAYNHQLATGATNGSVVIWDLNVEGAQKMVGSMSDHHRTVNRVNFQMQNPNLLMSGSQDGTIRLWDLRMPPLRSQSMRGGSSKAIMTNLRQRNVPDGVVGRCVNVFEARSGPVRDVQFAPKDANHFAAVYDVGQLTMWDLRQPSVVEMRVTAHRGPAFTVDWHPEQPNILATSGRDKVIKIFDTLNASNPRSSMADSSAGAEASSVTSGQSPGTTPTTPSLAGPAPTEIGKVQTYAEVTRAKWRPHHDYQIASCSLLSSDLDIHVWDLQSPFYPKASWSDHKDVTTGIQWHRGDPTLLLSVSKDGNFMLHSLSTAKIPRNRMNHTALSWGAHGQLSFAFSASRSERALLQNMSSSTKIQTCTIASRPPIPAARALSPMVSPLVLRPAALEPQSSGTTALAEALKEAQEPQTQLGNFSAYARKLFQTEPRILNPWLATVVSRGARASGAYGTGMMSGPMIRCRGGVVPHAFRTLAYGYRTRGRPTLELCLINGREADAANRGDVSQTWAILRLMLTYHWFDKTNASSQQHHETIGSAADGMVTARTFNPGTTGSVVDGHLAAGMLKASAADPDSDDSVSSFSDGRSESSDEDSQGSYYPIMDADPGTGRPLSPEVVGQGGGKSQFTLGGPGDDGDEYAPLSSIESGSSDDLSDYGLDEGMDATSFNVTGTRRLQQTRTKRQEQAVNETLNAIGMTHDPWALGLEDSTRGNYGTTNDTDGEVLGQHGNGGAAGDASKGGAAVVAHQLPSLVPVLSGGSLNRASAGTETSTLQETPPTPLNLRTSYTASRQSMATNGTGMSLNGAFDPTQGGDVTTPDAGGPIFSPTSEQDAPGGKQSFRRSRVSILSGKYSLRDSVGSNPGSAAVGGPNAGSGRGSSGQSSQTTPTTPGLGGVSSRPGLSTISAQSQSQITGSSGTPASHQQANSGTRGTITGPGGGGPSVTDQADAVSMLSSLANASQSHRLRLAFVDKMLLGLKEVLDVYSMQGDVQTCCTIYTVFYEVAQNLVPQAVAEAWFHAYIELLQSYNMHAPATYVIGTAPLGAIRALNQESTYFNVCCGKCSKILPNGVKGICGTCQRSVSVCSVCGNAVKGLYLHCSACQHGGHMQCLRQWFTSQSTPKETPPRGAPGADGGSVGTPCPTGCGHVCTYN